MDIIYAVLLFLTIYEGMHMTITWHILNPPIIFGEDAVLYCNVSTSDNCCTKDVTWMKDGDVIVDYKASTNPFKYSQKQHSDGFSLIIKHFDSGDINHLYTCLYDFFSYSAVLDINRLYFKYCPNKDEIKATINRISDTTILADIIFEKVYPLPECFCIVNKQKEKINKNVTVEEEAQTELFHKIKLYLICEIKQSECIESIEVLCTVGNDEIEVISGNFSNCLAINDKFGNGEKDNDIVFLLVFIFSCLTLCTAVLACFIMWKKRQYSSRTIIQCIEGCRHYTNYVNDRSPYSRSSRDIIEEIFPLITKQVHIDTNTEESENVQELDINNGTTCTDRIIITYANQILMEHMPHIKFKFKTFNLIIEKLTSRLEEWKSLYADWCVRTMNPNIYPPSLKDTKRSNRHTTHPAQKMKDVKLILQNAILKDSVYIQRLTTDTRINLARHQSRFTEFNVCTYNLESAKKNGRNDLAWVTCPAQKDVLKMVQHAIFFDKAYIQILVTNTRIHHARLDETSRREKQRSSQSDHQKTTSQTMDNSYYNAVPQNAATQMQIVKYTSALNGMNCSSDSTWLTCQAQNKKDVIQLIIYAKRHDTIYMQILLTNERINFVRLQYSQTKSNVV